MFDVGFSELVVIAVVALIVIGPERLPRVARTAGHLLGRLQRYVNDVKADINREMQIEELKRLQSQVQESARELQDAVSAQLQSTQASIKELVAPPPVESPVEPPVEPAAVVAPEAGEPAPLAAPAPTAAQPAATAPTVVAGEDMPIPVPPRPAPEPVPTPVATTPSPEKTHQS